MARAPFQVAAFPFRRRSATSNVEYAIFRRSDEGYWQSIAGGGEDEETPLQAVQRESFEEAGIPAHCAYLELQTRTSVPVIHFLNRQHWNSALLVIPVFYFGVAVPDAEIRLSWEHAEVRWVTFQEGQALLKWDSDKTALWELDQRLATPAR
ncbi:MAG: NUDIX pyrophosphatase [Anaerolineae bacterium]|nr:NUDIX pyrophosphatase [Anaerolineae bacterium]NUQ06936.1 NUDIX pyrophosphatase [Anaerolineae bacterium]